MRNDSTGVELGIRGVVAAMALGFGLRGIATKMMGISLASFARKHGFHRTAVSMMVNGYASRCKRDICEAMAKEMGVNPKDLEVVIRATQVRRAALLSSLGTNLCR